MHRARAVILATGSAYRELGLPNEKRLSGHGVSWCATCDGFFFRDQDIAVVGGGDSALEEATFLTRFARSVTVVHRRDTLRASKIMQARAHGRPEDHVPRGTPRSSTSSGDDKVTGVRLRDVPTGDESELPVTGLFVAIGHDPRVELFADQVSLDDEGYVAVARPHRPHQRAGRLRLRRRRRPRVPAGHHRGRLGLRRRARRRALPGRPGRRGRRRPGGGGALRGDHRRSRHLLIG